MNKKVKSLIITGLIATTSLVVNPSVAKSFAYSKQVTAQQENVNFSEFKGEDIELIKGYIASDEEFKDLTYIDDQGNTQPIDPHKNVTIVNEKELDLKKPGTYRVKYVFKDKFGKESFTERNVTVLERYPNEIVIQGGDSKDRVIAKIDQLFKRITISYKDNTIMNGYYKDEYASMTLYKSNGSVKKSVSLKGTDKPSTSKGLAAFNNYYFEYGDYIKISHKEPKNLHVTTLNPKEDLTDGYSNEVVFKITQNGLERVK